MPPLTEYNISNVRSMFFGEPKTKKTWFSVKKTAEAGYNVLLLNADKGLGREIIKDIEPEALKRIHVIDCADAGPFANFSFFMTYLLKGETIIWDDDDNKLARLTQNKEHNHYIIKPKLLTSKDVIIVDSYTKLVLSLILQYATENGIDLSKADRTDWDGYGWEGRLLDWMLGQLTLFDCNWIWIAHDGLHEKRVKDPNNPKREIVVSTSIHPKSSSRPHALTVSENFNDILYFFAGEDAEIYIDTRKLHNRDGGSRNIPPNIYHWDDISFQHIAGVTIKPATEFPAVQFVLGQEAQKAAPVIAQKKEPLEATEKSVVSIGEKTSGIVKP